MIKTPRITETIFFEQQHTVEVRSRPIWIAVLEFWFLWVHEFWTHALWERLPERFTVRLKDEYWGDPMEASFHVFYTWTLNYDNTIDKTARYTDLKVS